MYTISYYISDVLERIHLTVSGFWSGVGNPFYSLGEWFYDTISIWRA